MNNHEEDDDLMFFCPPERQEKIGPPQQQPQRRTMIRNYGIVKCIGRGNHGSAYLVTKVDDAEHENQDSSPCQYVLKKIPIECMSRDEKDRAHHEADMLRTLRHPYIVGYYESFVLDDMLNIVMQYCPGGDLSQWIHHHSTQASFRESMILDWFIQIALALQLIHSQYILHRDLKSCNIFLSQHPPEALQQSSSPSPPIIRLGDFGIAKALNSTLDQAKTVVGTPYYLSPEVCENKPYSYASDIWSLGVVLYELCAQCHPFQSSNLLGLVVQIVQDTPAPIPSQYSPELQNLVSSCLAKDSNERPTIDEILDCALIRGRIEFNARAGQAFETLSKERNNEAEEEEQNICHPKRSGSPRRPRRKRIARTFPQLPSTTTVIQSKGQWLEEEEEDGEEDNESSVETTECSSSGASQRTVVEFDFSTTFDDDEQYLEVLEDHYYSDDFESDDEEAEEDEILDYAQSSDSSRGNSDAGSHSDSSRSSTSSEPEELVVVRTPRRPSLGERVHAIRQYLQLEPQLGRVKFRLVYDFLRQREDMSQRNCKAQLIELVGRSKLHLCFEVDQLIYFENLLGES